MCSDPPRYYNPINRQAGRTLNLPPPRAARLFACLCRRSWAVWTGVVPTFALTDCPPEVARICEVRLNLSRTVGRVHFHASGPICRYYLPVAHHPHSWVRVLWVAGFLYHVAFLQSLFVVLSQLNVVSRAPGRMPAKAFFAFFGREFASAGFVVSAKASTPIANMAAAVTNDTFRWLALLNPTLYNVSTLSASETQPSSQSLQCNYRSIHFRQGSRIK
jgi:hypothetical protein